MRVIGTRMFLRSRAPYPDESLLGYILWLTEANGYETPSWILRIAGIDYLSSGYSFLFGDGLVLKPLSEFTGVSLTDLEKLTYPQTTGIRGSGIEDVFNTVIPRRLIHLDRTKVCPMCFAEQGYARRLWELAPVTACNFHECFLLDTCPNCRKPIRWARKRLSHCPCGFDWREATSRSIDGVGLELSKLVYDRCGGSPHTDTGKRNSSENPLYRLDLQHLLTAVVFFGDHRSSKGDNAYRTKTLSLEVGVMHEVLSGAFSVFESWPANFHKYLDGLRVQADGTEAIGGMRKNFGRFYPDLFRQLSSPEFHFIRDEFENYLSASWDGGLVHSRYKDVLPNAFRESKHAGKCEAARELHVSSECIDRLVGTGVLDGSAMMRGKRKVFRIEKGSLGKLRKENEKYVTAENAAQILAIDRKGMVDLIAQGFLKTVSVIGISGVRTNLFERTAVEELLARIEPPVDRNKTYGRKRTIGFKRAARRLTFVGKGLGDFVGKLLDGVIRPCGLGKGHGLAKLRFLKIEISKHIDCELRKMRRGLIPIKVAARMLGMKEDGVRALGRAGLLPPAEIPKDRRLGRLYDKKSIDKFRSEYLLAADLANKFRTSPRVMTCLFAKRGVMVFAGRSVDPALPNFYRRADVDFGNLRQFDLSKCLPTRKRTKRKSTLLNTQRAAKFLGIGEETLRRFVRGGDLSPRLPKGKSSGRGVPMRFSRFELDRFKRRRMDGRLIVSASEAARMMGTDLSWFYKRWVRTGRLAKIEFEDKFGRHFFRRTEVQKLVELKKSTVTGPEAAKILKTHRTAVLKMTKRGELVPVSGPGIDGFGCHLYIRADIEKYSKGLERESSESGSRLVA